MRCCILRFQELDPQGDLGSSRSQARAKITLSECHFWPTFCPDLFNFDAKDASLLELDLDMLFVRNGGQTSMLC